MTNQSLMYSTLMYTRFKLRNTGLKFELASVSLVLMRRIMGFLLSANCQLATAHWKCMRHRLRGNCWHCPAPKPTFKRLNGQIRADFVCRSVEQECELQDRVIIFKLGEG